jgi:hypothetical protein
VNTEDDEFSEVITQPEDFAPKDDGCSVTLPSIIQPAQAFGASSMPPTAKYTFRASESPSQAMPLIRPPVGLGHSLSTTSSFPSSSFRDTRGSLALSKATAGAMRPEASGKPSDEVETLSKTVATNPGDVASDLPSTPVLTQSKMSHPPPATIHSPPGPDAQSPSPLLPNPSSHHDKLGEPRQRQPSPVAAHQVEAGQALTARDRPIQMDARDTGEPAPNPPLEISSVAQFQQPRISSSEPSLSNGLEEPMPAYSPSASASDALADSSQHRLRRKHTVQFPGQVTRFRLRGYNHNDTVTGSIDDAQDPAPSAQGEMFVQDLSNGLEGGPIRVHSAEGVGNTGDERQNNLSPLGTNDAAVIPEVSMTPDPPSPERPVAEYNERMASSSDARSSRVTSHQPGQIEVDVAGPSSSVSPNRPRRSSSLSADLNVASHQPVKLIQLLIEDRRGPEDDLLISEVYLPVMSFTDRADKIFVDSRLLVAAMQEKPGRIDGTCTFLPFLPFRSTCVQGQLGCTHIVADINYTSCGLRRMASKE